MSGDVNTIMYEDAQFLVFAAQPHSTEDVMYYLASNRIPFQVLLGSYKGVREVSYLIPMVHVQAVESAGFLTEQESVMILGSMQKDGRRQAWLQYSGKADAEVLGWLYAASYEEAMAADGYSYNPMANSFFIVKN